MGSEGRSRTKRIQMSKSLVFFYREPASSSFRNVLRSSHLQIEKFSRRKLYFSSLNKNILRDFSFIRHFSFCASTLPEFADKIPCRPGPIRFGKPGKFRLNVSLEESVIRAAREFRHSRKPRNSDAGRKVN